MKQHSHTIDGKNVNIKRAVPRTDGVYHQEKHTVPLSDQYLKKVSEPAPVEAILPPQPRAPRDMTLTETAFPSLAAPTASQAQVQRETAGLAAPSFTTPEPS